MSAAPVLHDLHELDEPAPLPAAPGRRGHLRLVGADELADTAALPVQRRMRVTRRGRLLVTGTVTVLVAVTVAALIGSILPAGASTSETVVVEPGQTLSQIAATELPELPLDRAIVEIQLANELNSLQVQAGQTLEIPGE
jgi:hypothetical protein